ncbi:MAG: glycosyltransferase, partial [Acetobacteraceae bacterium]|nr:glycosyltransferase [Acetobacteraceae bacterium]
MPFDRRVWLEATTLARAGYRVTVICPQMKSFRAAHEVLEDVEIFRYRLPVQGRSALGFVVEFAWCFLMTTALSLRVAMFGRGFDVLHVCNPPETYWPLGAFWRLLGKRFVFDHHDLSPEMFTVKFGHRPLLHRMLLLNEWLTFRLANLVLTTNESHKEVALMRGGKRPGDVHIVRSGPDTGRLQLREKDPDVAGGFQHLVAYLGEICKQDGVEHLVRAMRILRDDYGRHDVGCVFVGGGPHQPEV